MEKIFEVRDRRIKEKFDIDDAYLNGYAKLCGIYATGVYVSLCRHADKEQKCFPSQKLIAEELNISEKQVNRSIKILESYKIIIKERVGKKANNRYWLTDKSEWTTSPIINKSDRTTSPIHTDYQSYHHRTTSPIHSKDTHIKDTHSKDAIAKAIDEKNINSLISLFKEVSPFTYKEWFGNTTQRKASADLLEKLSFNDLEVLITKGLPKLNTLSYVPRDCKAFSPYELNKNLDKIVAKIKELKRSAKSEKENIII